MSQSINSNLTETWLDRAFISPHHLASLSFTWAFSWVQTILSHASIDSSVLSFFLSHFSLDNRILYHLREYLCMVLPSFSIKTSHRYLFFSNATVDNFTYSPYYLSIQYKHMADFNKFRWKLQWKIGFSFHSFRNWSTQILFITLLSIINFNYFS
jgi:hypothetical protein